MPESSVVFSPELDERQLDREVDKTNDRLQSVGENVPVSFAPEEMDMGGMGGGGLAGRGGGGLGGAGGAVGAGALASRIPKPVAGVATSAALPIAIAGGVGASLLSAMHGASARLQTSTTLMGQAWNNVWRPMGDDLDKMFVRPVAKDLLNATQDFEDTWTQGYEGAAVLGLLKDLESMWADGIESELELLGVGDDVAGSVGNALGEINWANVIATGGISLPAEFGRAFGQELADRLVAESNITAMDIVNQLRFNAVTGGQLITAMSFNPVSAPMVLGRIFGDIVISETDLLDFITGGGTPDTPSGPSGPSGPSMPSGPESPEPPRGPSGPDFPEIPGSPGHGLGGVPGLRSGGRVMRSGVAEVHRGELVSDPDRLVSELAQAVDSATGGGGTAEVDMSAVENKLDRLNRNIKRLERAFNVTLEVGQEEIGRAALEGQRSGLSDTDPLA
jgi:hypothetical protein